VFQGVGKLSSLWKRYDLLRPTCSTKLSAVFVKEGFVNIAVACGGTGGHIFPGLAIAAVLQSRGHDVTLWLAGKTIETIATSGWVGSVVTVQSGGVLRTIRAVFRCYAIMRRKKPDVVLAMGGFGSVAPCIAARLLEIPYVLHEANAVPGRAVRFLSRGATAVAVGFESVQNQIKCRRVVWTGIPVRSEILSIVRKRNGADFCILILGGSGGAHAINEVASLAICALPGQNLQVIHLTGPNDERFVAERYSSAGIHADVRAFSQNMAELYARTDFVICRAGASTCAELVALRIPALLIPLPWAADDHQTANARALEATGLVDVVPQADCSVAWLTEYLRAKVEGDMSYNDISTHDLCAAERLAALVEECAHIS
jgi:UDP-N-acetylglucosamine--N-acetylmuramyl-(pentapeptide) pyrophosphoryl-undecaprenol N-acetylglucosamine transferase